MQDIPHGAKFVIFYHANHYFKKILQLTGSAVFK
jgi:hypothetical protein